MAGYKRGGTFWFKFRIHGQLIRESARTASKTLAKEAERVRRRKLEEAVNQVPKRERMPLFSIAAERWLEAKSGLSHDSELHYRQYVNSLSTLFGRRLVCDITADDIASVQRRRENEGKSGRTSNAEIAVLRQILKRYGLWNALAERGQIRFKRERRDIGRAIWHEHEVGLLDAIRESRSPVLLPLFVLAIDTGLRASELRHRRRDLRANWVNGLIDSGEIVVSRS